MTASIHVEPPICGFHKTTNHSFQDYPFCRRPLTRERFQHVDLVHYAFYVLQNIHIRKVKMQEVSGGMWLQFATAYLRQGRLWGNRFSLKYIRDGRLPLAYDDPV